MARSITIGWNVTRVHRPISGTFTSVCVIRIPRNVIRSRRRRTGLRPSYFAGHSLNEPRDTTGFKDPADGKHGDLDKEPPRQLRGRDYHYWGLKIPGWFDDVEGCITLFPCYDQLDCVYAEVHRELCPGTTQLDMENDRSAMTLERVHIQNLREWTIEVREKYDRTEMADRLRPDPELAALPQRRLTPGLEWGTTGYKGAEPPYEFSQPDFQWELVKMPSETDGFCPIGEVVLVTTKSKDLHSKPDQLVLGRCKFSKNGKFMEFHFPSQTVGDGLWHRTMNTFVDVNSEASLRGLYFKPLSMACVSALRRF